MGQQAALGIRPPSPRGVVARRHYHSSAVLVDRACCGRAVSLTGRPVSKTRRVPSYGPSRTGDREVPGGVPHADENADSIEAWTALSE